MTILNTTYHLRVFHIENKIIFTAIVLCLVSLFVGTAPTVLPSASSYSHNTTSNAFQFGKLHSFDGKPTVGSQAFIAEQVEAGNDFVLIKTLDTDFGVYSGGHVYGWGNNSHGQVGVVSPASTATPEVIAANMTHIEAGHGFSFVWNYYDATVYASGTNSHGQLGIGHPHPQQSVMHPMLNGSSVRQISAGFQHAIALVERGIYLRDVYTWGQGRHGQIGDGGEEDRFAPVLLTGMRDKYIMDVCAGTDHSVALNSVGALWVWGGNQYGQLGLDPDQVPYTTTPQNITVYDERIAQVYCGEYFTVGITYGGAIYAFGLNDQGQLGFTPGTQNYSYVPHRISKTFHQFPTTKNIDVGRAHVIACTVDRELYGWGSNRDHALDPYDDPILSPGKVYPYTYHHSCRDIAAGDSHSVSLTVSIPGYYYTPGLNCTLCWPGSYSKGYDAVDRCPACPQDEHNLIKGATRCEDCPEGQVCPYGGCTHCEELSSSASSGSKDSSENNNSSQTEIEMIIGIGSFIGGVLVSATVFGLGMYIWHLKRRSRSHYIRTD